MASYLVLVFILLASISGKGFCETTSSPPPPATEQKKQTKPIDEETLRKIERGELVQFRCMPNGWGDTKEKATQDLWRVAEGYRKRYGHKPGFTIHDYVGPVNIARGKWQADGLITWYTEPVERHEKTVLNIRTTKGRR